MTVQKRPTLDIAPLGRSPPHSQAHCRFAYYSRRRILRRYVGRRRRDRIDRAEREEGPPLSDRERNEPEFSKSNASVALCQCASRFHGTIDRSHSDRSNFKAIVLRHARKYLCQIYESCEQWCSKFIQNVKCRCSRLNDNF